MRGASPFFYRGGSDGFLLVHGFTGSPWEMRFLGKRLHQRGYTVLAPRLKGHGTSPEQMITTRWRDWQKSVVEGWERLGRVCERRVVVGLSMGGVLALHLAAHYPVDAVISLSAPFRLQDPKLKLLPLAKRFPVNLLYRYERELGRDIKDPAARRSMVCYSKTPVPCVVSLMELMTHVWDDLEEVRAPLLVLHAKQDHTVPFENSSLIYEKVGSLVKRLVPLERSYHVVTVDVEKERVAQLIVEFVEQVAFNVKMR